MTRNRTSQRSSFATLSEVLFDGVLCEGSHVPMAFEEALL